MIVLRFEFYVIVCVCENEITFWNLVLVYLAVISFFIYFLLHSSMHFEIDSNMTDLDCVGNMEF